MRKNEIRKKPLIGIATDEEFRKARQRWRERVCPGLFVKTGEIK